MKRDLFPFTLKLEFARGCNFACDFCAIHSVPRDKKFIDANTLIAILSGVRVFDPIRIDIAMRGEPTLHPDFLSLVQIVRVYMPQSQITLITNGNRSKREDMLGFFAAGGNIVILDCYRPGDLERHETELQGLPVIRFYEGVHRFNPYKRHPVSTRVICLMDSLGARNKERQQRKIYNQGGNVDFKRVAKFGVTPLTAPLVKQCIKPFREITTLYDGSVILCCMDWKAECIFFDAKKVSIAAEWFTSLDINKVRQRLLRKDRAFLPCNKCDFQGGFRLGLTTSPWQKYYAAEAQKTTTDFSGKIKNAGADFAGEKGKETNTPAKPRIAGI